MKLSEKRTYIDDKDQLVVERTYDPTETIEANKDARALAPKHHISNGKTLVKVMEIDEDHVLALYNMGYNLLSPDPDEWKRALLYIQNHEPVWLTVNGKPIASFRQKWV
jgi:cytochrome b involved in lipid metabolism